MSGQDTFPKALRTQHANALIQIIAGHGRHFFRDRATGRIARLELDVRGRVWFFDDFSNKRIYTHTTPFGNRWSGFSHGGTLKELVEHMRDYIVKGEKIPQGFIAPNFSTLPGKDYWGYGPEACLAVRHCALALPIIESTAAEACECPSSPGT